MEDPRNRPERFLGACRAEIEAAGVHVETAIAETIPHVLGDVTALRSALQNFLAGWHAVLHATRQGDAGRGLLRWAVDVDPLAI